jgi:hypothetical protein
MGERWRGALGAAVHMPVNGEGSIVEPMTVLPEGEIGESGPVSRVFRDLGITSFHGACRHVHRLPYGYNSDRNDGMILFKEGKGSCTTKHAVVATLARELGLPVVKQVGIYAMTEAIVTGTDAILARFGLPYLPMVHCFLSAAAGRVDLTEGNRNGKNTAIDAFLFTRTVTPNISGRDEYRLYRRALTDHVLTRPELAGTALKTILHAREAGLSLLKDNIA